MKKKKPTINHLKVVAMIKNGKTYKYIGEKYGVSKQRIGQIATDLNKTSTRWTTAEKRNKELFDKIAAYVLKGKSTAFIQKRLEINQTQLFYIVNQVAGHGVSKLKGYKRITEKS